MFAVPGWSVSAGSLKTQTAEPEVSSKKKRKRGGRKAEDQHVDADNIAALWEQHVEGKDSSQSHNDAASVKKNKKRKREHGGEEQGQELEDGPQKGTEKAVGKTSTHQNSKSKRTRPRDGEAERKPHDAPQKAEQALPSPTAPSAEPPKLPSHTKLTPLQQKMQQKLQSSRFRYLNETLYTTPSTSSLDLFAQNPVFFSEYHEGFRRQVTAWPENPVDGFVQWLLARGKIKPAKYTRGKLPLHKDKRHRQQDTGLALSAQDKLALEPLPHGASQAGRCSVIDLGCGEAKLASSLEEASAAARLKVDVKSFDLAAPNPRVTVADIRSLPLQDGSVDVAVFCLALMGTNWIEFVEEAYRVLHWKGECWIAEVASRFGTPKKGRVEHSVGNKSKDKGGKQRKKKNGAEQEEEVEGDEQRGLAEDVTATLQPTTDVSAFVAVLRRRGFVLQGEPDTKNKMFVRMRFVKALPATRGKCAQKTNKQAAKLKFIDEDDNQISVAEESRVLKPCVYKTR